MKLETIGKYIKKYRIQNKMRQEDLAEKTGLSANYIGMIERGEKVPALDTFISIVNCLHVTSDMLLVDVIEEAYKVKTSLLIDKIETLSQEDRNRIYDVVETLINHSKQIKP